jgi:hypothetical protein
VTVALLPASMVRGSVSLMLSASLLKTMRLMVSGADP